MSKSMIAVAMLTTTLTGCVLTEQQQKLPSPVNVEQLDSSLAQQKQQILAEVGQANSQQATQLTQLSQQLQKIERDLKKINQPVKEKLVKVPTECPPSPLGEKFILGQVEQVYIDELKSSFETRIDTGAESSSLDAHNIQVFERDGKDWVKFDVYTQGKDKDPKTFESEVTRFVRIKQNADQKDDRRPVIHAHLQIGKYTAETDLNLTDRSHLDYPLLLGRKFMQDIAVVDVGRSFIHGKQPIVTTPQTTTSAK
ncbi:ATP-dependent zinc protease family protein [Shewanella marina]|uniref:ATP-dependent zinc protease family protein n=1 Tax=Shewanella marina TaxID=487319 RepID=UPI00046E96C5|nr:ATP-dependent zinc protease [Shewanella marina]